MPSSDGSAGALDTPAALTATVSPSARPSTEPTLRPEPRAALSPGWAHLLAWLALALVNAVHIASTSTERASIRAAHHYFDAGQLLAVGVLAYGAISTWRTLPRRRGWVGYALTALVSMALGWFVLPSDTIGFVLDRFGDGAVDWVNPVFAAAGGLAIPAAALTGAFARRSEWLRAAAIVSGLFIGVANLHVLEGDYRGVHVVIGFLAATMMGAAASGIALPQRLQRAIPTWRRLRMNIVAPVMLFAIAAPSVAIAPSQRVRVELFRSDGAVVAPLLAWQTVSVPVQDHVQSDWFASRRKAPPVPPPVPPPVNGKGIVIMVTMDSVRAEVLLDPKYNQHVERLRELADESVEFSEARSPGSGTVISFSQIFSGKHYFQLKWSKREKRALPHKDKSPRVPELLTKAGVQTVTFATYEPLMPANGVTRGFKEATLIPPSEGQDHALSAQMVDAAIARIHEYDGGPMFMFLHLMDPHHPYDAAGTTGSKYNRYLREAGLCSEAIGRLVDALIEADLWDKTTLIVGADHGEGFKKHGIPFHNIGLYEEILHVPLFIRMPGAKPRRITTPVSTLDLAPTLLHLFGLNAPGSFMGESLTPFLAGQDPKLTRPIVASTLFKSNVIYDFPLKLIFKQKQQSMEVYDLSVDPDERNNLADTHGAEIKSRLDSFKKAHAVR